MIKFMKYYWLYFIFSGIFIIPGIYSLLTWGLKPSIDFTGGSVLELQINSSTPVQKKLIETAANTEEIEILELEQNPNNTFVLRAKEFDQTTNTQLQNQIASVSGSPVTEKRFETLGPTLGIETLNKTLAAISIAVVAILLFVWKQFNDKKYGICAILAMLHDSLVVFGIFSLLGHFMGVEIDTLFMTAVLTILSFSVHDTIVVYDRIRESLRKHTGIPYETIVNKAVNETLGRSVNNSMTIIFMLFALYLLGGVTIKWFVFALLVGTISGTYSSTFTAAPLLVLWDRVFKKRK